MTMFRQRRAILALFLVLLTLGALHLSLAASGGVMGGSASSGSSSSDDDWRYRHSYYPGYSSFSRSHRRTDYYADAGNAGSEQSHRGFGKSDLVPVIFASAMLIFVAYSCYRAETTHHSVLMIQVGLSGVASKIVQKELNRTAKNCDTSTASGLNHILKVSSDLLLQNINHCVSAYSSVNQRLNVRRMSKLIDQLSNEERAQFDVETLVNVDGTKLYSPLTTSTDGSADTDSIVVVILVAAEGSHDLPVIEDRESLREALASLRLIGTSETKKVFVLWTPQNKDDSLSEEELIRKYPYLRPLRKYAAD